MYIYLDPYIIYTCINIGTIPPNITICIVIIPRALYLKIPSCVGGGGGVGVIKMFQQNFDALSKKKTKNILIHLAPL